jgi:hypothetical protein
MLSNKILSNRQGSAITIKIKDFVPVDPKRLKELYPNYCFEPDVFDNCSEVLKKLSSAVEYGQLYNTYLQAGHDLAQEPQFSKYGLIELNNQRTLLDTRYPIIVDAQYDIAFSLNGFNSKLWDAFSTLCIGPHTISVRPNQSRIYSVQDWLNIIFNIGMDHRACGCYFAPDNFNKGKLITRLYDEQNNHLWVKIDSNNHEITFEEILSDFYEKNDFMVTNMFHLTYKEQNGERLIEHFDQEYIFYTQDEYIARMANPEVKGTGQKRIKTFKIDNAKIPLDIEMFLLPMLLAGFSNEELVREYFSAKE